MSPSVSLASVNTKCHIVTIGQARILFSYGRGVAYRIMSTDFVYIINGTKTKTTHAHIDTWAGTLERAYLPDDVFQKHLVHAIRNCCGSA